MSPSAPEPTGPASRPPAATSAPAPTVQPAPGWDSLIAAWLALHKSYPEAARSRGEEGEVVVRFTVAPDGRVLGVEIVRGSGSAPLDDAARTLLAGARVPPPRAQVTRTVRLRYRLE
jgi:periplasmic protein TonB